MKKYLMIGGGVIALAAAGWSGLWFMGKSEIERRVQMEQDQLDAQGWTLSWGNQEISGFPVGYTMQMTDVAVTDRNNGILVKLGDVTAAADGSNPDRIVTSLPAEVKVTIPTRAELLALDPNLPRSIQINLASEDLVVAAEDSVRTPSDDEIAVLDMLAGAPELARTLRRDLDDSVLWTDLWQRTNRMLEGVRTVVDTSPLSPADRTRVAFNECMSVADAFAELAGARYQRRTLHLVVSFITRALEDLPDEDPYLQADTLRQLRAEAESVREHLAEREQAIRARLMDRVDAPSPLSALDELAPGAVAGELLVARISETLAGYRFGSGG